MLRCLDGLFMALSHVSVPPSMNLIRMRCGWMEGCVGCWVSGVEVAFGIGVSESAGDGVWLGSVFALDLGRPGDIASSLALVLLSCEFDWA
jgi:hypothetical protein